MKLILNESLEERMGRVKEDWLRYIPEKHKSYIKEIINRFKSHLNDGDVRVSETEFELPKKLWPNRDFWEDLGDQVREEGINYSVLESSLNSDGSKYYYVKVYRRYPEEPEAYNSGLLENKNLKEDNTENLGLDNLKLYKLLIKDSKDNTKWVTTAAFDEEKAKYYVEKGNAYYFNGDIPEVIEVREIKENLQEDLIFDYTKEDVATLKDLVDKEENPIKKKYLKNALSKAEYETYDPEDEVKDSGELEITKEEETMKQDDSEAKSAEEHPAEALTNNGIADMINNLIKSEFDAITDYNNAISTLISEQSNLDMIPVIEDILKEENNHVGMLQTILKQVSGAAHEIKGGEKEAKEIQASNE